MQDQQPKQSLKVQAYQYLRDKILSCEYAPDHFLSEQQLCEEMGGLSRTPMRDAIGRLEQEGLIIILPKRGLMVAPVRPEEIQHIYEVRLLIEPYALRVYGSALSQEALEQARAIFSAQGAPLAGSAFCEADDAFHALMLSCLQNPYLQGAYERIAALNSRLRVLSDQLSEYRVAQTYAEHVAVIDACIVGDYEAAAQAMEYHLQKARQAAFEVSKGEV